MTPTATIIGKVVQVTGPAVDCEFPEGQIPQVHTAVRITSDGLRRADGLLLCRLRDDLQRRDGDDAA